MCCVLCYLLMLCFFFFKQKTAYELRISDWSSDVCSSDLDDGPLPLEEAEHHRDQQRHRIARHGRDHHRDQAGKRLPVGDGGRPAQQEGAGPSHGLEVPEGAILVREKGLGLETMHRSEEHTSELQSLMRLSYAVFCLKKTHNPRTLLTN